MKVMISVTHLLGTGHLSRALTLGRAFAAKGHEVTLCSGGMPTPQLDHSGVRIEQLPPLRSDGTNFTTLLDGQSAPVDDTYLTKRRDAQNAVLNQIHPDVVLTELFPFGRRVLSDEFLSLLQAASGLATRPVILSSIRDILAPPSKSAKVTRTHDIITQYYDAVLVHSDPVATRLDLSWPVSDALSDKLRYTGFVAPPVATDHPDLAGKGEILVSAGGGSVGTDLFRAAIMAAKQMPDTVWRLLVGGSDAERRIESLKELAKGTTIIIEPARPDFRQMLRHAAASVSMCGYNTALDLLQAGTPAVMIPFDEGSEVEQTLRAESLSALPAMSVVRNCDLNADRLHQSLKQVLAEGRRTDQAIGFDGAARSVEIAEGLVQ